MESPLRREAHGGFGERPGETGQRQRRHRAPGRLSLGVWCDYTGELLAMRLRPGQSTPTTPTITSTCSTRQSPRSPRVTTAAFWFGPTRPVHRHPVLDFLTTQGQVRAGG